MSSAAAWWMGQVASLGCVACRNAGRGPTPAQVHHLTGHPFRGIGKRADDTITIPLCNTCHNDLHRGVDSWELANGEQHTLLAQTIREVAKNLMRRL